MLTSENPNFKNVEYYTNSSISELDEYYISVIELLIKYKNNYSLENLVDSIQNSKTYLSYFMDKDEYPKYFKIFFDSFNGNDRIKVPTLLIKQYKIWEDDYDSFVAIYHLYHRLKMKFRVKNNLIRLLIK